MFGGRKNKEQSLSQTMMPENAPKSKSSGGGNVTGFDPEGLGSYPIHAAGCTGLTYADDDVLSANLYSTVIHHNSFNIGFFENRTRR